MVGICQTIHIPRQKLSVLKGFDVKQKYLGCDAFFTFHLKNLPASKFHFKVLAIFVFRILYGPDVNKVSSR